MNSVCVCCFVSLSLSLPFCVSLCLLWFSPSSMTLAKASGGGVGAETERGSKEREETGFFPLNFFSVCSINSSRAAECHLLSHN